MSLELCLLIISLAYASTMKMETACSSESLVNFSNVPPQKITTEHDGIAVTFLDLYLGDSSFRY